MSDSTSPAPPGVDIDGFAIRPGVAQGRLGMAGARDAAPIRYVPLRGSSAAWNPGPLGWAVEEEEGISVPRSLEAPVVGGIDADLVRAGEFVRVDGDRGQLHLPGVERLDVVTAFLERADGRILLLLRSEKVGSFQGHWAGVSGFLEDDSADAQAYREIREETGVLERSLLLAARGRLVYARDRQRVFAIHPYRFRVAEVPITLDWEHTEYGWIRPEEMGDLPTVPKLDRVWARVASATTDAPSERNRK